MNDRALIPNKRILIIDDNPAIHEDFRKILGGGPAGQSALDELENSLFEDEELDEPVAACVKSRFEIDSAFQGQEGLEMVSKAAAEGRPYSMAFVDVRMPPGWDGIETISRIWERHGDLQIVICTAYSDYSWNEITLKLGHSDSMVILKKPFDNVEVMQLAHALTNKWEVTQQADKQLELLDRQVGDRTAELERANAKLKREIEERARAQQALQVSEERFSRAFKSNPMPMAILTLEEQRHVDVNEAYCELTGYERNELIFQSFKDLDLFKGQAVQEKIFDALLANRALRNHSCSLRRKDNKKRSLQISAEIFRLGADPHLLLIAQDVTERVNLESQLRQSQKMEAVGQLAAGVAHDFNNILTVIRGHIDLQMMSDDMDEDVQDTLSQVGEAAERAASLTRQLLAFSRKQVIRRKTLCVNGLVSDTANMVRRLIGENYTLELDLGVELPPVFADVCAVEQVIMNLAVNARDSMPDGGLLCIRTKAAFFDRSDLGNRPEARSGNFICVTVEDHGVGMPESVQQRIFEPFFTTKGVGKGTGMGLATVYGLVKQHKGWIELDSVEGEGTTFRVYLPISTERIDQAPVKLPRRHVSVGFKTVLVAEDEKALRRIVAATLQHYGYKTILAASGPEALDLWREHRDEVDLLLTDMVMPGGISGRDLAEQMRSQNPLLKVIYTSGYSPELICEGMKLTEGENYLPKPYSPSDLADIMEHAFTEEGVTVGV